MYFGFKDGNIVLQYTGLVGLPLFMYGLYFYMRLINRIEVEADFVKIKNVFFGKRMIYFKDIEHWEENYVFNMLANFIMLKVKGKKVLISDMIDKENYNILLNRLSTIR
jgi:hypothetical protein